MMYYGAIEAGGTKFVCAIATPDLTIVERVSIPTTTPNETMAEVTAFFDTYKDELLAIGVGSFGPIDVNPNSKTYGFITTTTNVPWAQYQFVDTLKEKYSCPIAWTTDVNAAAFGELKLGAAKGKKSCIYLTVGTGIGGGVVIDEEVLAGFGHPELGHIVVRRDPEDSFEGTCPFHGDC